MKVRKLIEESPYNIKLLSVGEINIDLRAERLPVVYHLVVSSDAIHLFNIHLDFDQNRINKDKLELMKNIFNTEQEENSYSFVLKNYTGNEKELIEKIKEVNYEYIRKIETDNNDLHLIIKKQE